MERRNGLAPSLLNCGPTFGFRFGVKAKPADTIRIFRYPIIGYIFPANVAELKELRTVPIIRTALSRNIETTSQRTATG